MYLLHDEVVLAVAVLVWQDPSLQELLVVLEDAVAPMLSFVVVKHSLPLLRELVATAAVAVEPVYAAVTLSAVVAAFVPLFVDVLAGVVLVLV